MAAFISAVYIARIEPNYMTDKIFVDTNILVYAHDVDDRSKQAVARDALRGLWNDATGVISPQVLQEFYVSVTRKIAAPISKEAARQVISAYAIWCIDVTSADVAAALRIEDDAKIGFWDALIIASAAKAGATKLLTEDLNPGQVVAGIMIENPFAKDH
jgi:predicted nucleic acid-binding protein